jgi:hypothetical protein
MPAPHRYRHADAKSAFLSDSPRNPIIAPGIHVAALGANDVMASNN